MSKTKLGFSTGKGFLEEVDKAQNATNADNSTKVNSLEIKRDANGVLRVGEIIIPQKRLIYTGTAMIARDVNTKLFLSRSISEGDILELHCSIQTFNSSTVAAVIGKVKILSTASYEESKIIYPMFESAIDSGSVGMVEVLVWYTDANTITVRVTNTGFINNSVPTIKPLTSLVLTVNKVYKIIE